MKRMILFLSLFLMSTVGIGSTQSLFFQKHSLVFLFASTCPYCHDEAPILADWAANHQAKVLAFSFDDRSLPEFPNASPVTKELVDVAFSGQPIHYPALFVMENETNTLYPVAFGALNQTELNDRMMILLPNIQQFEQKALP
jgi:type-F conjugative transfer system pilin assembly thiol-disulfide isomerase TrbB